MQLLGIGFMGSLVWVVILLIFRNVVCWYWKINEHIAQQNAIIAEIRETNNILNLQVKENAAQAKKYTEQQEFTNTLLQDLLKK